MAKTYYNKLVRDRIPEILKAKSVDYEIDILSDDDYLKALDAKLDEEVAEYHENPCIEELADIYTVLTYIFLARDIDMDMLNHVVFAKARKNGFFDDKIMLKWVDEKEETDA